VSDPTAILIGDIPHHVLGLLIFAQADKMRKADETSACSLSLSKIAQYQQAEVSRQVSAPGYNQKFVFSTWSYLSNAAFHK
jgi:hypothetical protein